ncbi:MAG: lactate utilization protein [Lachnospiraceae bacterium]
MNPREHYYEQLSTTIGKNLEKRNMAYSYCKTAKDAVACGLSLLKDGDIVSFGGSMTLTETGMLQALKETAGIQLLDRSTASTPEETTQIYRDSFSANAFFMSTNAITIDGELVNTDGIGNRVAALVFGPEKVIILAGMNKVVPTLEAALGRIRTIAAPPNAIRLNRSTPCAVTGTCSDCLSPDCMCGQTVITRRSSIQNRIHVILIGESYGY